MTPRPFRLARFGELLALSALALAQPLFDLLGRQAEFLVAHDVSGLRLVGFTVALLVGPAVLLALLEALVGAVAPAAAEALHHVLVALLAAVLALVVLRRIEGLPAAAALVVASAAGIGASWSLRFRSWRSFLRTIAMMSPLLALYFLLATPARQVLFAADAARPTRALPPRPLPIVIVLFDELPLSSLLEPDGGLAAARFPAFAGFASRSTWYRRATSTGAATENAVPALLTGRESRGGHLPVAAELPDNLFTWLGGAYAMNVHESLTRLCPPSVCVDAGASGTRPALWSDVGVVALHLVLPPQLAAGLPSVVRTWGGFAVPNQGPAEAGPRARDVKAETQSFLDRLAAMDPNVPALHYLHLEVPHIPWRYLPSGREYGPINSSDFANGVEPDSTWRDDPWLIAQGLQRHLLQLAYADRLLSQIVEALESRALFDRALVVVTADHGVAFLAGEQNRSVSAANFAEVLGVPLFLKLPDQRQGAVSDLPVRLVDVVPTIAAVVGAPLPWSMDGRSMLDADAFPSRSTALVIEGATGNRREFPLSELAAGELRASRRIAEAFGAGSDQAALLSLATRPGLAGRSVAELDILPPSAAVVLEQPWFFERVAPESGFVPAQVTGRLLPLAGAEVPRRAELAVAINGVLRATTRSFEAHGAEHFSALVPEDSLVAGRNVVEIYLVEPGDAPRGPRLRRLVDRSGPRYRLRRGADAAIEGIEASNGTGCTIEPGTIPGGLVHEEWWLAGWALPPADTPFLVIMVFMGDELIYVTTTGRPAPPGSAAVDDPAMARAGFRYAVPQSLTGGEDREVRVFAVNGPRCSELRFP